MGVRPWLLLTNYTWPIAGYDYVQPCRLHTQLDYPPRHVATMNLIIKFHKMNCELTVGDLLIKNSKWCTTWYQAHTTYAVMCDIVYKHTLYCSDYSHTLGLSTQALTKWSGTIRLFYHPHINDMRIAIQANIHTYYANIEYQFVCTWCIPHPTVVQNSYCSTQCLLKMHKPY